MNNKDKDLETGSGNIFADLGLPNPEERMAKAKLAMQINLLIKKKRLSQIEAAELLGTDQSKISALHKGKLSGFSLERLFRFLNVLGQDVIIKVTPKTKAKKTPNLSVNLKEIKRKPVDNSTKTHSAIMARKK